MNFARFIALRIYRADEPGEQVSRPAVLIAMIGIAIGLAVMIISVSVIAGFKSEIRDKIVGFGSHIQISNIDATGSYETRPVIVDDSMRIALAGYAGVKHVQRYSTKPGMIKTADAFQGMVLKGVGPEYDRNFFLRHLVEGEFPQFSDSTSSNRVVISKSFADKLKLKVGDKIDTYYIQDDVRARRLEIVGIYQTNFSEYDNLFLLTDLYIVNRLNKWKPNQVSGVELEIRNYDKLEETTYEIAADTDEHPDCHGAKYCVRNVEQLNPQIFAWLNILDVNIWVILVLMVGVAGFTMISGLLIIIIERTSMIGVLKSLGTDNLTIRKVFLWFAVFLIGKGMLIGNGIGLAFYFIQRWFSLFKLDPETYYMATVPVSFNVWLFLLLNAGTLSASILMLIGPSYLITRISPATSIRYE
ncbi:ABC transporter permease [uncultured Bacteroides sp.]|uniref:ABC transporter permease n=1 Tax=uncultured Bacteroides sp. TaxID=162156 RepID=UPI0023C989D2|nr:ABC transporter permease [uncultured Bacteroides sp.]MDE5710343.1 ABC transporter permease [Bacteroides sp.]